MATHVMPKHLMDLPRQGLHENMQCRLVILLWIRFSFRCSFLSAQEYVSKYLIKAFIKFPPHCTLWLVYICICIYIYTWRSSHWFPPPPPYGHGAPGPPPVGLWGLWGLGGCKGKGAPPPMWSTSPKVSWEHAVSFGHSSLDLFFVSLQHSFGSRVCK